MRMLFIMQILLAHTIRRTKKREGPYRNHDGKFGAKTVKKFGTVEELREKLNGADPIEWARAKVAEMTKQVSNLRNYCIFVKIPIKKYSYGKYLCIEN